MMHGENANVRKRSSGHNQSLKIFNDDVLYDLIFKLSPMLGWFCGITFYVQRKIICRQFILKHLRQNHGYKLKFLSRYRILLWKSVNCIEKLIPVAQLRQFCFLNSCFEQFRCTVVYYIPELQPIESSFQQRFRCFRYTVYFLVEKHTKCFKTVFRLRLNFFPESALLPLCEHTLCYPDYC